MAAFDVDLSCLSNCRVNSASGGLILKRESHAKTEENIAMNMRLNSMRKYMRFCEFFNLDALNPACLKVAFILGSKLSKKEELVQMLCEEASPVLMVDNLNLIPKGLEIMSVMSDWCNVLSYMTLPPKITFDDKVISAMISALYEAKLSCSPDILPHFSAMAVIYISLSNVSTSHMLQRCMQRFEIFDKDVEIKCLKISNYFNDKNLSVQDMTKFYVMVTSHIQASQPYFNVLRNVMKEQDLGMKETVNRPRRPSLRAILQQIHRDNKLQSSESFESWASNLRFSVTTSTQLQRLLYFIHVQTCKPNPASYSHLFSLDTLNRLNGKTVESIDVETVCSVIAGLRSYQQNVKKMVDFRTSCLMGLSMTQRQALSSVMVARLYICVYQHDSIWEACWRSVHPTLNQTICSARNQFIKKHDFEIEPILQTMIFCHVDA